jgi:hypothetical protein
VVSAAYLRYANASVVFCRDGFIEVSDFMMKRYRCLFIPLIAISFFSGCAATNNRIGTCPMNHSPTSDTSTPITPAEANQAVVGGQLNALIETIGPAKRDIGSATMVLEWDMTDGRTLRVSSSLGLCSEILNVQTVDI